MEFFVIAGSYEFFRDDFWSIQPPSGATTRWLSNTARKRLRAELQPCSFSWDVLGSPPQSITLDAKPNTPGALDILTILSGGAITPPTDFPLLIPDDFSWVLKFGMLADMLTKETESRDLIRAQYCEQRFAEGVQLMMELPWLVARARIG